MDRVIELRVLKCGEEAAHVGVVLAAPLGETLRAKSVGALEMHLLTAPYVEERALDEVNVVQALAEGRVADERGGLESHGPDEGVRPLHVSEEVLEKAGSVHVESLLESGGGSRFAIPRSAAGASESAQRRRDRRRDSGFYAPQAPGNSHCAPTCAGISSPSWAARARRAPSSKRPRRLPAIPARGRSCSPGRRPWGPLAANRKVQSRPGRARSEER